MREETYIETWVLHSLVHAIHIEECTEENDDGIFSWDITTRPDGSTTVENWQFSTDLDWDTSIEITWDNDKSGEEFTLLELSFLNLIMDTIRLRQKELSKQ